MIRENRILDSEAIFYFENNENQDDDLDTTRDVLFVD